MNHDEPTIKDVLDAISEFSTNMDGQFREVKGDIQEIKRDISSINTRLASIEFEIQSVKEELHKLAQKDQEDSDALSRAYAQLEKRIVELEGQVKQLRHANQPHFA